ncbi:hypothetical protein [Pseudoalteromonas luteoviolacea]|uniref:hypothetical protein n=1 Tax=Pseudoalteromonas luteoviolacea TaxID=43657 RepID=UPI0011509D29|nr:hypothetical protein [Pseudoalteromonas luteoviolacea]TQF70729.1 hypothetical protein FLM44_06475 [Pseudoalteromonas luteoviolacea]
MIEHIHENEDWASLKTNVGDAKHVPDAILALLSDDEDEVERAYWKIDNHVVLQSDLSESAKYVPKYLEEVLIKAKFKGSTLELLFQIGYGASPNKDLENECYQQVMDVLERTLSHRNIAGTQWEEAIKEDISDLKELYNERT